MPVASMTGFARVEGATDAFDFAWELRSVNGKGLDLRLRLPAGCDALEPDARRLAGERLARGSVQAGLSLARRAPSGTTFAVNETMLAEVLALSDRLVAAGHAVTPTADGLLAIRGLIEAADAGVPAEIAPDERAALLAGLAAALDALVEARRQEGAAMADAILARVDAIEGLVGRAEADPARQPDAIRDRLRTQVARLLDGPVALDEARLHAEAMLLAVRADVAEELDRLQAHVAAARALLGTGGAVGRRLEFLAQEFGREANTLCAKSNAASLTAIGLDMKLAVDQLREQALNLE